MQKNIELIESTFPRKKIKLRSGFDRYGFSTMISSRIGFPNLRSFGDWLHGWIWYEPNEPRDLMFSQSIKNKLHVVSNTTEAELLRTFGFTKVIVGGLPFAYTESIGTERLRDSLLCLPLHSSESDRIRGDSCDYLNYIESIRRDFDSVYVSIHGCDVNGAMHRLSVKMGLNVIFGADPSDGNALRRMRAIFDSFEYVSSNCLASHVPYALASNCAVSIVGPENDFEDIEYKSLGSASKDYIDKIIYYSSRGYLRSSPYKGFLVSHPRDGIKNTILGHAYMGYGNRLNRNQLIEAFSWTTSGQFRGGVNGLYNRLTRRVLNRFSSQD